MTLQVDDRAETGELVPPELQVLIADAFEKFKRAIADGISGPGGKTPPKGVQLFSGWYPLLGSRFDEVVGVTVKDGKIDGIKIERAARIKEMGQRIREWP